MTICSVPPNTFVCTPFADQTNPRAMKLLKFGIYVPTPNPRPGGGHRLLAALVGCGALRPRISR